MRNQLRVFACLAMLGGMTAGCGYTRDAEMCDAMARDGAAGVAEARRMIEQGANVNRQFAEQNGGTCLMLVSELNISEGVAMLLGFGADPNIEDRKGRTALNGARSVEVAKLLIEHGADVNHRRDDGLTLLDLADQRGREEIHQLLRDAGAVND